MYHYVRDAVGGMPQLNALATAAFESQLSWLDSTRRVIDYASLDHALSARTPLDGTALLTFDDGLADHHETVFPRLRERSWSGVFFLCGIAHDDPPRLLNVHKTHLLMARLGADKFAEVVRETLQREPITAGRGDERSADVYRYDNGVAHADIKHLLNYELPFDTADQVLSDLYARFAGDEAEDARRFYLSVEAIREMSAAGMTFGFHSERHRVLARLALAQQREELEDGAARVRALTGQQAVPFCYPYGHSHTYDASTVAALASYGYSAAFTTSRRIADPSRDARFEIPRLDTRDLPPFRSPFADA
jgi:peptidoglycan/xylan/chitin deacetylase (PgdA/CDA1 family)